LIDKGLNVRHHVIQGWWIDTGKKDDMLEANRLILETIDTSIRGMVDGHSQILGKVIVEEGAEIRNSVIRGPVIIGRNAKIVNAYVGPFTAIDHDCVIHDSEVEHSIILENSSIVDISERIEDSLIGRNVEITRSPMKPKAHKFMLGDYSRVGIL
jgi:glucose-1-phosphate thymidylyltransferase